MTARGSDFFDLARTARQPPRGIVAAPQLAPSCGQPSMGVGGLYASVLSPRFVGQSGTRGRSPSRKENAYAPTAQPGPPSPWMG
jgi:hypothetical protein